MIDKKEINDLKRLSIQIKIETMKTIEHLGVGHVGGSLSISDLLAVLYGKEMKYKPEEPRWEDRDWLVVSKGHSGPAVYSALALKGFFPKEELMTLNQPGTNLPSHCDRNRTIGVDMTTGSLGQGASTAAGVAMAHKIDHKSNKIYLILGDGECQEGQVWEMALFAAAKKLNNLIAFIDYNNLQIDGYISEVNNLGNLSNKFNEFGWYTQEVDGHNVVEIYEAIEKAKEQTEKPSMIVLKTIKGHGWSRIENQASGHSMPVSSEALEEAIKEFEAKLAELA